jgi:hypothetical protein
MSSKQWRTSADHVHGLLTLKTTKQAQNHNIVQTLSCLNKKTDSCGLRKIKNK